MGKSTNVDTCRNDVITCMSSAEAKGLLYIWYMYIERIVGGYTVIVKTLERHVYSAELHVHITEY